MRMNKLLIIIGALLIIAFTHFAAYYVGVSQTKMKHAQQLSAQATEALNNFVDSSYTLTDAANNASQRLEQQIIERRLADEKTTRDIRHALKQTADTRISCVFDANSLQHLDAARTRATQAITSGFSRELSDTTVPGE